MDNDKIPSAEEYLDFKGAPLIPGLPYESVDSNGNYSKGGFIIPLSRPSKIMPFWNCDNTRNPCGRKISIMDARKLRLSNLKESLNPSGDMWWRVAIKSCPSLERKTQKPEEVSLAQTLPICTREDVRKIYCTREKDFGGILPCIG